MTSIFGRHEVVLAFVGREPVASAGECRWHRRLRRQVMPPGVTVSAVGNTWDANQQGADANGHYQVVSQGVPLDVSGGPRPNYFSPADNQSLLRLAE